MNGQSQQKRTTWLTNEDDAIVGDTISRQAVKFVNSTGSQFVDGVVSGYAWKGDKLTYAFPDSKNDYQYSGEKENNFGAVGKNIQDAVRFILDKDFGSKANDGFSLEGFTNIDVSKGADRSATLRYAESNSAGNTAYAYLPNSSASGGDTWFGTNYDYNNAKVGNYEWATVVHETGHALGLKHGHETNTYGAIPDQWNSLEYSVMTYRSYADGPNGPYSNEEFGFPQTFMMADIAALQHMYGANFKVNSGNTTYEWKPNSGSTWVNGKLGIDADKNVILATIWDGGGSHDVYDLSAYRTDVYVDLRPGAYSTFSKTQRADLDWSSTSDARVADGNIYNALLYKGDKRSYIEDAIGGGGDDGLVGNVRNNILKGNSGEDILYGDRGNDTYIGGKDGDLFVFKKNWDKDTIRDFGKGDEIDLKSFDYKNFNSLMQDAEKDGKDLVFNFGNGDTLTLQHTSKNDLSAGDFVL